MLSKLADRSVPFAADRSNRQPVAARVHRHLVHTLLHDPQNLVINGVQIRTVGAALEK